MLFLKYFCKCIYIIHLFEENKEVKKRMNDLTAMDIVTVFKDIDDSLQKIAKVLDTLEKRMN